MLIQFTVRLQAIRGGPSSLKHRRELAWWKDGSKLTDVDEMGERGGEGRRAGEDLVLKEGCANRGRVLCAFTDNQHSFAPRTNQLHKLSTCIN